MPVPRASGTAPNSEAMLVIRMGRKRSCAAWRIAAVGSRPSLRCSSRAKSTIMMPFFMTMPISSTMPIKPMMSNCVPVSHSASKAPRAADSSVERMVTGCTKLS